MVDRDLVLGVDCSTTSAKAMVWDAAGVSHGEGRAPLVLHSPRAGWYEQRVDDWWTATASAVRTAVSAIDPGRLRALCVTHQRETFAALGPDGGALRDGIVWMDERASAEVRRFADTFGRERLHRLTGKPPCLTPSLYKMLWLAANEPAVFRAARFADVHAVLAWRLTGRLRTAVAAADPMGLIDLATGYWASEVLWAAGLTREALPELMPTGAVLGDVTAAAAEQTGLPVGLPVIAGGGDGQVAALGAGLGPAEPGRAYLNLGTAVVLGVVSPDYVVDASFRTMAGAAPGTFVIESDLKGGALTVEWFLSRFGAGASAAEMDRAAADVPPGADGLVLVPYWASVMNPYWDDGAAGIVVGWHERHGAPHLYRAILEGIAFEQRLSIEGIERATGRRLSTLVVLGGGAKSALWCRIVADVTGKRVVRSRTAEATCLGAGMLAAVGSGLHADLASAAAAMTGEAEAFEPNAAAARYDRLFREVYVPLYPALRESLGRLAALRDDAD